MKTIAPILGLAWILSGCVEDWGSDPFPELADIPEPPEQAQSLAEKRAIAADMAAEAHEDDQASDVEDDPLASDD